MTTITELEDQQRDILEISSVISSMLTKQQLAVKPLAKVAHTLLCELCNKMEEHLAEEHKGVYPNLLTSHDTKTQNLAWGLINNDKMLKPEFKRYTKRWLKNCDFQFTDTFIEETKDILDTIMKRMDIEYHTMIPKIENERLLDKVH